jgi:hypothetical protein
MCTGKSTKRTQETMLNDAILRRIKRSDFACNGNDIYHTKNKELSTALRER